jgi:hypothetical protein
MKEFRYEIVIRGKIAGDTEDHAKKRVINAISLPLYMLRPGWKAEIEIFDGESQGKEEVEGVTVNPTMDIIGAIDRGINKLGDKFAEAVATGLKDMAVTPENKEALKEGVEKALAGEGSGPETLDDATEGEGVKE